MHCCEICWVTDLSGPSGSTEALEEAAAQMTGTQLSGGPRGAESLHCGLRQGGCLCCSHVGSQAPEGFAHQAREAYYL